MKTISYLLTFIVLSLLSSCEKAIKVDLPPHQPKLTINCHLTEGEVPEAIVSHSLHSMSNSSNFSALTNAEVVLFENGIAIDTLVYFSNTSQGWENYDVGVFRGNYIIKAGKTYKVQAKQGNYETAYGETLCPGNSIKITEIDLSDIRIDSSISNSIPGTYDYFRTGKVKFKVSGPSNEILHYFLSISDEDEETSFGIISNDPIIAGEDYNIGDGGVYPTEKLYFAGSSFTTSTFLTIDLKESYPYETDLTDDLIIKLEVENNDYHEYMKKMSEYEESNYNPFVEMVFLPNNIKGGYGVVSAKMIYEKIIQ